jgi:serine/threonine protein kinase/tetratricopeptide (TPR) repeat protein
MQLIGRQVAQYRVVERLGGGGMGVVYRAEDTRLGRTVALKFLSGETANRSRATQRMLREARAAAAIDHPNVCTLYEVGETDNGELFLAMAYCDGETLAARLARGPLPVDQALALTRQIVAGLAAGHARGVVHRDVKPGNIMLVGGGVKVLDFGLARVTGETTLTADGSVIGTLAYMAPEQARGEEADERADVWAVGAVLYEMLSGNRPFAEDSAASTLHAILNATPPTPSTVRPGIPRKADEIVATCLAKKPAERFQQMHALDKALTEALGSTVDRQAATDNPPSIAVLPFADMSPEQDQDWFCDGIAEELINSLTRIRGLRVTARTSSFRYRHGEHDVRQVGIDLDVSSVLEGSVRKAGDRIRVTAQLIDTASGYHRWSDRYDRQLADVFAIQEEIAERVVEALRSLLSDEERPQLNQGQTRNVAAYELYLRGRQLARVLTRSGLTRARDLFTGAVELDPEYALAWCGIADCSSWLYSWLGAAEGDLNRAMEASTRALKLAPKLAEAQASHGFAISLDKRFSEAERALDEAIRLNPDLYDAHYLRGRVCFAEGKKEEALRSFEKAAEVRPDDYQAPNLVTQIYREQGRQDLMQEASLRALALADRHLEAYPKDVRAVYLGAGALVDLGRVEEGLARLEKAIDMNPNEPIVHYMAACVHGRLGNVKATLDALETALDLGFGLREWIEQDTDLDSVRNEPRYKELLSRAT